MWLYADTPAYNHIKETTVPITTNHKEKDHCEKVILLHASQLVNQLKFQLFTFDHVSAVASILIRVITDASLP